MRWPFRWPPATWQAALVGAAVVLAVVGIDAALGRPGVVKAVVLATGVWPAGIYLYDQLVSRGNQVTVGMTLTVLGIGAGLPLLVLGLLVMTSLGPAG